MKKVLAFSVERHLTTPECGVGPFWENRLHRSKIGASILKGRYTDHMLEHINQVFSFAELDLARGHGYGRHAEHGYSGLRVYGGLSVALF